jgi:hypothetical protein
MSQQNRCAKAFSRETSSVSFTRKSSNSYAHSSRPNCPVPVKSGSDEPLTGPCAKECCNAKSTPDNKYCRKHQLCVFIDETTALGKRVCKNVIRGCTAQLDSTYELVRCEPCRKREKERDDARKAKKLVERGEDENPQTRLCNSCDKIQPLDEFVGTKNKGYVKSCKTCRETWKQHDVNKDKEHRNELVREAANNSEVREKIGKKSRSKRAAKDIDGYLQHNANVMKNWRDPEKMEEANRKRRESLEAHYKIYQRSARLKKLKFEFSEEEFKELVVKPCYYCGIVDEKGFDCIDRMNQQVGYIHSNSVSCCAMCNWLKGSLDSATFIKRTRHIHSFLNNADITRHPECFPDAKCVSYASYRSRAEKKDLEFSITHDDYKSIIQQDCYLCGKKSTETNTNGVDRVDNTIGYTIENCKACCKECNHMKNNYALDTLKEKIERIQDIWKDRELPILPAQIYSIVQIAEKMSKEEIKKEREEIKHRALKKHQDYLATIAA